jgi:hypothetical protein
MSEPTRAEPEEHAGGAPDPGLATPHRPWVRVVTLVVLAVFVLATLVSALLV